MDILQRHGFLGVIANVPASLHAWLAGKWSLMLCEHIPGPEEVLRLQARGIRPVTVLCDYPRMLRPILNKSDAHAFMIHDLEHAYKFFHDPVLHRAQRRFFSVIGRALYSGVFDDHRCDPVFAARFEYLISDMNTHVMHSLQYLRAILVEHYLRREHQPPAGELSPRARAAIETLMENFHTELNMTPQRTIPMPSASHVPPIAASGI